MTEWKRLLLLKMKVETCIAYGQAAVLNLNAPAESVVECCTATDASSLNTERALSLSLYLSTVNDGVYSMFVIATNVYTAVNHMSSTLKSEFDRLFATVGCGVSSLLTVVNHSLQSRALRLAVIEVINGFCSREQHSGFWFFPCIYSCNEIPSLKLSHGMIQTGCSRRIGRLYIEMDEVLASGYFLMRMAS